MNNYAPTMATPFSSMDNEPIVNNTIPDDDSDGESKPGRRTGRRKIKIEFIQDKSRRHITFSKRKAGIMKKAYELSTLTGTQILLVVVSETGLVYTFTTPKLQAIVTEAEGKNLIQSCLNTPDPDEDDMSNRQTAQSGTSESGTCTSQSSAYARDMSFSKMHDDVNGRRKHEAIDNTPAMSDHPGYRTTSNLVQPGTPTGQGQPYPSYPNPPPQNHPGAYYALPTNNSYPPQQYMQHNGNMYLPLQNPKR